ncbi:hypothetical protein BEL05_03820 [Shewanella colwelliana]|uniref:Uncharacterized protein n=2 Tax=Shewanella colwelliana TaxID=23 RepID=A0A1E5INM5_SHECO|nr:hypothetical protein BEL05_03820 [Shewanella colwelliana]
MPNNLLALSHGAGSIGLAVSVKKLILYPSNKLPAASFKEKVSMEHFLTKVLTRLQDYRSKNGIEHTPYDAKYDQSNNIKAIHFQLSYGLGKFSIERDLANNRIVIKERQWQQWVTVLFFVIMAILNPEQTWLLFAAATINIAVLIIKEIKIVALKRFLFE